MTFEVRPIEAWEVQEVKRKLEAGDDLEDREEWIARQMFEEGCKEEDW